MGFPWSDSNGVYFFEIPMLQHSTAERKRESVLLRCIECPKVDAVVLPLMRALQFRPPSLLLGRRLAYTKGTEADVVQKVAQMVGAAWRTFGTKPVCFREACARCTEA